MAKKKSKTRNYIILPVCLLLLNAVEEVVVYKVQGYPKIARNAYLLTGVLILLFTLGFSVVGDMIAPYLQAWFEGMHKKTHQHGGKIGLMVFYVLLGLFIFFLYFRIYTMGPQTVLPPSWR